MGGQENAKSERLKETLISSYPLAQEALGLRFSQVFILVVGHSGFLGIGRCFLHRHLLYVYVCVCVRARARVCVFVFWLNTPLQQMTQQH